MSRKKFLYFLAFVSLLQGTIKAQSSDSQITELRYLCKTWGFLKYYHPNINEGNIDWDQALINELGRYLNNEHTYNESLKVLWETAGPIDKWPKNKGKKTKPELFKLTDFSWLNDSILPASYSAEMKSLHDNFNYQKGHYATLNKRDNENCWGFYNDRVYSISDSTTSAEKLWILFNYWNKMEYYWPNKHLLISSWDSILDHFTQEMLLAKTANEIEMNMYGINNALNDSHAHNVRSKYIWIELRGHYRTGIDYIIQNDRVFIKKIINSDIKQSGILKVGDEILSCNKGSVTEIYEKVKKYAPFSNRKFIIQLMENELAYSSNKTLTFLVKRENKEEEVQFNLSNYSIVQEKTSPILLSEKMVYYNVKDYPKVSLWNDNRRKHLDQIFSADTIILDLRVYPSFWFHMRFTKYLYEKGAYAEFLDPKKHITKPGEYVKTKAEILGGTKKKFKGLLVLLVDDNTTSLGEVTAMALQQYKNCVTIGTPTWGTAAYTNKIDIIPNRLHSEFTSSLGFRYNGQLYDHSGIELDYLVDYTKQDEFEWKEDYILESAIQYIRGLK